MYTTCTVHVHVQCTCNLQFFLSSSLPPPSSLPPSLPPSLSPSLPLPPSLPQLECCGVNSSSNWEVNPNVMTYPDSCCPGSFNTSADPLALNPLQHPEPYADVRTCFVCSFFVLGLCVYIHVIVHKMKSLCSPSLPPPSPPPSLPQGCEQALTDFIEQNLLIVAAVGITFVVAEVSRSLRPIQPTAGIWSYFMQWVFSTQCV